MRKIAILGLAAVMTLGISTSAFAAAPFEGKQTASALLDQDWNSVEVTIDLSDGWSAEFVRGAVYLYNGPADAGNEPAAMGLTLNEDVYRDYVAATDSPDYKEENGIVSYKEEDGTQDYFFEVEVDRFEPAHFMITVDKGVDGDAVFNRFDVKRTIADFEVAMAKIERFDAINQQLLSVVDAQILEVNDAMNTLACMLLDSISELSYDDADFVIDVVEQYLSQIPGDEENKRRIVRRYASLIVADIRKQI